MTSTAGLFTPTVPTDWGEQYVDGNAPYTNFSKTFYVQQAIYYSVLELDVLTAYEDRAASAVVRVNNQQVGIIEPRPLSRYQDLQPYSIFFGNGVLAGSSPHSGPNNLTIEPVNQFNWLVVARWRIHYNRLPFF